MGEVIKERGGFKKLNREIDRTNWRLKKIFLWMGNTGTTLSGRDWIRCFVFLLKLRIRGIE